jgi:hypothetical protein
MRLNFELTDAQINSLKALQQRTGASSMKDLVNAALSILKWAVDETANGNDVAAINESDSAYRVLVTPMLQHVAEHERQVPAGV